MPKRTRAAPEPDELDLAAEDAREARAEAAALEQIRLEQSAGAALWGTEPGTAASSSSAADADADAGAAAARPPKPSGGVYDRGGLKLSREGMGVQEWQWQETLAVTTEVDVSEAHDDLSREMAFYNAALASVGQARTRMTKLGVAWRRPEDFFCEMVKTDAHMAKIKEQLVFEQKKMEAFELRKAAQEQRKVGKSVALEKTRQKREEKKDGLKKIDDWRKDNKGRRGALPDHDERLEAAVSDGQTRKQRGEKRKASDKKYGFGGKDGAKRKKNSFASQNDLKDFNPKKGKVTKYGANTGGGGGGGKGGGAKARPGKARRAGARAGR